MIVNTGFALALMLVGRASQVFWIGIVGIVLMLAGVVQALIFCRCPYCGAQLEPRGPVPKFCPKCGKKLD